jgi:hypothetical protein
VPDSRRASLLTVLLCGACFVGALTLYTRENTIPYYYHSDEPSKVNQVTGARALNFKHPLLLMNSTRAVAWATDVGPNKQRASLAGRWVSATFGALSVAGLVALAWRQRGAWAAVCVAPIVLLSHGLFTFSHFMKEDTALVVGIVATLLAATEFLQRPTPGRAALLGAACGLALSGKYIGAVMLLPMLPLVIWASRRSGTALTVRALGGFAAGLVLVVALVNVTVFFEFDSFLAGLGYETDHATTGGGKPFASLFSLSYVYGLASQSTWPIRILAPLYVGWVLLTFRSRRPDELLVALFPVVYLALLQSSPIKAIRYLLPIVVIAHYLAGLAVAVGVERLVPSRWRAAATAIALALVLAPQVLQIRTHLEEFAGDSRLALYEWVKDTVPEDARILQDRYAGLPDRRWGYFTETNPLLPQPITTRHFVGEFGDVAKMKSEGIEFVAVCGRAFSRFFEDDVKFGSDESRAHFETMRDVYTELFDEERLVFEAGGPKIAGAPVNPIVRVFALGEDPGPAPTRRP